MATIERFEEMEIWKDARELCKLIFEKSEIAPWKIDFKFKDQIRAASGSVMDNIAEGFERGGNKEFKQFLSIAKGSAGETRSQLYRAFDFNYITNDELTILLEKTTSLSKRISKTISYLKTSEYKGPKYH